MLRPHQRRPTFESLEDRRMLAFAAEGTLIGVKGTKGDDIIQVERLTSGPQAGYVRLTMNGEQATYYYNGSPSSISAVVVLGMGGDDQITIADNIPFDALIDGGKGDDVIECSGGDDVVLGGAGDDTILCGEGHDIALGGRGDDGIYGDDGEDALAGDAGLDAVYGDDGDDALRGGRGNDLLDGGDGADVLMADAGIDLCYGGDGDDLLDGGAGNDFLFGEDGNDFIAGDKGNDECHGGDGKDGLFGDAGKDSLFGDDNNDHLDGGKGADNCLGGDGDDQLKGGRGKDQLDGQAGDNLLDRDDDGDKDILANGIETDIDIEISTALLGTVSATYQVENRGGIVVRTLTVELTNYEGPSTVDVVIGGFFAGQIDTHNTGDGRLVLSTDPTGDEQPFPPGFPTIGPDSQFQIGQFLTQFGSWSHLSTSQFTPTFVT
jgi:Ca2+-binding RTX toxin-like protein